MQTATPTGQPLPLAQTSTLPRRRHLGGILTVAAFLVPAGALYGLFVLFPIAQAGYFSLFRWKGLGPLDDYVGLANFERILADEIFVGALRHNLTIAALSILVQLPLALGLALLIRRRGRGRAFFRTVFFLPFVLSEVITGLIWTFIYLPDRGALNGVLSVALPGDVARGWLADPGTVLFAVFAVITWKYFGFHLILYLAGMQNIPAELEEAARIDGATDARVLRDVTLPLLGPTIRLSVFLSVLGSLQFFDLVWVMTGGGPINASDTMATYLYKFSFQRFALGYGAAVSLIVFLLCFAFSLVYQRLVMRRDFEGA